LETKQCPPQWETTHGSGQGSAVSTAPLEGLDPSRLI